MKYSISGEEYKVSLEIIILLKDLISKDHKVFQYQNTSGGIKYIISSS